MHKGAAVISAICAAIAAIALSIVPRLLAARDGTRVVAIHAGGGNVPANLLRVYVELSGRMEPGTSYEHIRLVDERRQIVAGAFLDLREELWSGDHRRLTLLFDPGRVKRGIRSNVELGPPLVASREYSIVVDSSWRDAAGRPLVSSFEQRLRVGAFDSISPNPSRWVISSPRIDSRDELRIEFGEPLDHALAGRMITVVRSDGSREAGRVSLSADDRVWHFAPTNPWGDGMALRVDPALEDLAGNNLSRAFDVDRERSAAPMSTAMTDTTARFIRLSVRR
jgi:hypothetical protein